MRVERDAVLSLAGRRYGVGRSLPTKVSGALDAAKLSNVQSAVGGALDGRYYLHISRESTRLLVYDTEKGLWSEEDVCSCDMTSTGGQLYLWDGQALWAADPTASRTGRAPTAWKRTSP